MFAILTPVGKIDLMNAADLYQIYQAKWKRGSSVRKGLW